MRYILFAIAISSIGACALLGARTGKLRIVNQTRATGAGADTGKKPARVSSRGKQGGSQ